MSTSSSDRAAARRRARLAARGEPPPEEPTDDEAPAVPAPGGGGFLRRIFPPAPPLAGKPDPLAGFDASGPLRPIRVRVHLLRQLPWVWLGLGALTFLSFTASLWWRGTILELLATFTMFGALIAAGWFGWPRPTLYGTATAVVGYVLSSIFILWQFSMAGAEPGDILPPEQIALVLLRDGLYQAALGFLGGWYGGYLRRRQAQLAVETRSRRR